MRPSESSTPASRNFLSLSPLPLLLGRQDSLNEVLHFVAAHAPSLFTFHEEIVSI